MKRRIFLIVHDDNHQTKTSQIFDLLILVFIVASTIEIVLESEESLALEYSGIFQIVETTSIFVFTIEYLLKLWSCVERQKYSHAIVGRLKYASTPSALVDLLAILPAFLPFLGIDLRFLRALRLLRIFRILKITRYTKAFNTIHKVLKNKSEELIITSSFIVVVLIIVSTLMYYAEREAQPEQFSSILKSLWWGVVTLTTVGYGDIYPITPIGKVLNGIITLIGIGLIALPSGILASGYTEELISEKQKTPIHNQSENY
ncbi:ion transporter [Marinoscillum furvescens]|nr:ion transporter [Marinoscillum furvescens]